MVRAEIFLYLCLARLLIAGVGSTCVPVECLRCNVTGETVADSCSLCRNRSQCTNGTHIPKNCTRDFNVFVNTTGSDADEGDAITLTCVHDLPPLDLTFEWNVDDDTIKGENKSQLVLEKVFSKDAGVYMCSVQSPCGSYKSEPHGVTVNNNSVIILVICGVAALVMILIMGLLMKFKLQRDRAKHIERMMQRAQAGLSSGPAPVTPREA